MLLFDIIMLNYVNCELFIDVGQTFLTTCVIVYNLPNVLIDKSNHCLNIIMTGFFLILYPLKIPFLSHELQN